MRLTGKIRPYNEIVLANIIHIGEINTSQGIKKYRIRREVNFETFEINPTPTLNLEGGFQVPLTEPFVRDVLTKDGKIKIPNSVRLEIKRQDLKEILFVIRNSLNLCEDDFGNLAFKNIIFIGR